MLRAKIILLKYMKRRLLSHAMIANVRSAQNYDYESNFLLSSSFSTSFHFYSLLLCLLPHFCVRQYNHHRRRRHPHAIKNFILLCFNNNFFVASREHIYIAHTYYSRILVGNCLIHNIIFSAENIIYLR
jgi:hypothetical protein